MSGPSRISAEKHDLFGIRDKSLRSWDAPFYQWLKDEGFEYGFNYGNYGIDAIYVDLTRKLYACAKPGVGVGYLLGDKYITIEEFKTIYYIYKSKE